MNKQEFMTKLVTMYPSQFAGSTADEWVKIYEEKITGNIDYDRLWNILITEYEHKTTPAPKWLVDRLPRCEKEVIKSAPVYNTYIDIEITARELYGDNYDTVLRFTATEQDVEKLKAKGKKFKIVSEPYKMGD